MLVFWRLLAIFATPAFTWLAWQAAPEVVSYANLRFLAAIFAVCWGMAFYFLRKTGDMTGLPGLSVRERDRLLLMMKDLRRRVQWIAAVTVVCPLVIWFAGAGLNALAPWSVPVAVGLLTGVGLSYLIVLFGWLNEIHEFADKIRMRDARKECVERNLKRISDAKKQSQNSTQST